MNNSEGIGSANARFAIGMFIQQSGFLRWYDQINVALVDTVFRSASKQAPIDLHRKVMKNDEKWCEFKTRLKHWTISGGSFEFMPSTILKGLTHVNLYNVQCLTKCLFLDAVKLKRLHLSSVSTIVNIMSDIGNYQKLASICIDDDNLLSDISPLAGCTSLVELHLLYCHELKDISALERCPALKSLNLSYCYQIQDLPKCRTVTNLYLEGYIPDLSALSAYHLLSELAICNHDQIIDISVLSSCPSLQSLYIESTSIIKIKPIGRCLKLTKLRLYTIGKRKQRLCISFLKNCTALKHLDLVVQTKLKGTTVLGKLPFLTKIYISPNIRRIGNCKGLVEAKISLHKGKRKTLAGIEKCHRLEKLELSYSNLVSDISVLEKCKSLTTLIIN